MHRKKILELLENYKPFAPEENVYKQMITEFVQEHPGCFERSERIGHITASCLLLNRDGTKTLLTHHKKLNRWLQLGGHCDGMNDPLVVAIKEAQEESGLESVVPVSMHIFDVDIHLIPATTKDPAHYHYDVRFLLQTSQSEDAIVVSDESHALQWFAKSECPSDEKSLQRLFLKCLSSKIN